MINLNSQTRSNDTFIVDPHQNATSILEERITKATASVPKSSDQEKSKTSGADSLSDYNEKHTH